MEIETDYIVTDINLEKIFKLFLNGNNSYLLEDNSIYVSFKAPNSFLDRRVNRSNLLNICFKLLNQEELKKLNNLLKSNSKSKEDAFEFQLLIDKIEAKLRIMKPKEEVGKNL